MFRPICQGTCVCRSFGRRICDEVGGTSVTARWRPAGGHTCVSPRLQQRNVPSSTPTVHQELIGRVTEAHSPTLRPQEAQRPDRYGSSKFGRLSFQLVSVHCELANQLAGSVLTYGPCSTVTPPGNLAPWNAPTNGVACDAIRVFLYPIPRKYGTLSHIDT